MNALLSYSLRIALATSLLAGAAQAATSPTSDTAVGTVTFALGDTQVVAADGTTTPVRKGSVVHQADVIQTGANGQVHVRMVDQALVSVRPNSELLIQDYRYDAGDPARSTIKFVLREGTVRSITGKGGAAAKDRYRLNTPLAAIGIRGTDFTVRSTEGSTRVGVKSGAIALSPFNEVCKADGIGECKGEGASVLSAAMRDLEIEVQRGALRPALVPNTHTLEAPDNEPQARASRGTVPLTQSVTEAKSTDRAETVLTQAEVAPPQPQPVQPTPPTTTPTTPVEPVAPVVPDPVIPPVVVAPPVVPDIRKPAIAWGRYADLINAQFTPAEYSSWAKINEELGKGAETVANLGGIFGLVRSGDMKLPSSGTVGFQLAASESYLAKGSQFIERANITNERLTVDFGQRTFSTSMQVTAPNARVSAEVSGSGIITGNTSTTIEGLLRANSTSPDTYITGTLADGGTQAGLLFQRNLSGGQALVGATRWTH